MTDKTHPLDNLRGAHEEEYFRKHNRELIDAMRQKMATDEEAKEIEAETGIHDQVILHHLAELGIDHDTVHMVHLVPLVEVAWADGQIHDEERELLLKAADSAGIKDGPARDAYEALLLKRPTQGYFDTALDFVRAMLVVMDEEHARQASGNLEELAYRIADAAGGVFGLWGRVDDKERDVLKHIADRLHETRPEASSNLLTKL
jgi:tellurite resistance protein